ncbi:hypothetical protein FB593_10519 [Rhizobium sp. SJZ105]|uniref:hypothetical protein n=1 Tax=Rhizobium sp. SJZ105 TaxID=2572678 RepID=UPI0011A11493|nr:hypothetical protein [Rhizobium sp. SJZ105]TWC81429.1 hypothetical protein FB593_10519 [Rhizobium sp. SJZ105]
MAINIDNEVFIKAESTNREVLQHLLRQFPFIDIPASIAEDDIDRGDNGKHYFVFWNTEAERKQIECWASANYSSSLPYGITLIDVTDYSEQE